MTAAESVSVGGKHSNEESDNHNGKDGNESAENTDMKDDGKPAEDANGTESNANPDTEETYVLLVTFLSGLVGKIFRNIAMFPIFCHLAKTEKKYRQFGYEMST